MWLKNSVNVLIFFYTERHIGLTSLKTLTLAPYTVILWFVPLSEALVEVHFCVLTAVKCLAFILTLGKSQKSRSAGPRGQEHADPPVF